MVADQVADHTVQTEEGPPVVCQSAAEAAPVFIQTDMKWFRDVVHNALFSLIPYYSQLTHLN